MKKVSFIVGVKMEVGAVSTSHLQTTRNADLGKDKERRKKMGNEMKDILDVFERAENVFAMAEAVMAKAVKIKNEIEERETRTTCEDFVERVVSRIEYNTANQVGDAVESFVAFLYPLFEKGFDGTENELVSALSMIPDSACSEDFLWALMNEDRNGIPAQLAYRAVVSLSKHAVKAYECFDVDDAESRCRAYYAVENPDAHGFFGEFGYCIDWDSCWAGVVDSVRDALEKNLVYGDHWLFVF